MARIYHASSKIPLGYKEGYGFVYILGKSGYGPTKIGMAIDARRRIGNLETANGHRFHLIWVSSQCSNFSEIEKELHARFVEKRTVGEWFDIEFGTAINAASRMKYDKRPESDWEEMLLLAERGGKPPPPEIERLALIAEGRL